MEAKLCYFNEVFNPYLYSGTKRYSEHWNKIDKQTKRLGHGTLRLTKWEFKGFTFYTFGLMVDDLKRRPGHGGEWSSNCMTIKEVFGIDLISIALDQMSISATPEEIEKYINTDVYKRADGENTQYLGYVSDVITPEYDRWYDKDGKIINKAKSWNTL